MLQKRSMAMHVELDGGSVVTRDAAFDVCTRQEKYRTCTMKLNEVRMFSYFNLHIPGNLLRFRI